jgi:hypothetical protein
MWRKGEEIMNEILTQTKKDKRVIALAIIEDLNPAR